MQTFEVIYTNDPRRNRRFKVRGICEYDVLNPCWDNRRDDIPGKHWGGGDACPACAKAALGPTGATMVDKSNTPNPTHKPSVFCGIGWVFLDPDDGWSYSEDHPKLECPDAEMIRRSTEMEDHLWKEYKREWTQNNAHLFPPFPPKRETV